MGLSSYNDIIAAKSAGRFDDFMFQKTAVTTAGAGILHSQWLENGAPAAGATDSGGTQYVNGSGGSGASANKGGFGFNTITVGPTYSRYGTVFSVTASQICQVAIFDRLCAISGVSLTSLATVTLTTLPALPTGRTYNSGLGVYAFAEVTTATSTTACQMKMASYTNQAGTAAQVGGIGVAPAAAMKVGDMWMLPLASGDLGVQGVASVQITTASSAGVASIVLMKQITPWLAIPVAGGSNTLDLCYQVAGLPPLYDGCTLQSVVVTSAAAAPIVDGFFSSVYN